VADLTCAHRAAGWQEHGLRGSCLRKNYCPRKEVPVSGQDFHHAGRASRKRSRISLHHKAERVRSLPGRYSSISTPCHARYSIKPLKFEAAYFVPSLRWTAINVAEGPKPKQNPDGSISLEVDNIPALESEPIHVAGARAQCRGSSFYYGLRPSETYWAETFKARSEEVERFLGKPKDLAAAVASTVSAADSDEQKLRKIYARVQRLRNLSHERGLTLQELKREEIKENKKRAGCLEAGNIGTGGDIDLLFVGLARAAVLIPILSCMFGRNRGLPS